jgi:hypothetical protein
MSFLTSLKYRLPKKRWKRALLYAASTFFIALAVDMALTAYWRRFTVSRETTYITAPLFPEGAPDYITWLNQRAAQGVTPDNNAAVPLIQAIGMPRLDGLTNDDWEARMWRGLGVPESHVPGKMLYFVPWMQDQTQNGGKNPQSATQSSAPNADPKWIDDEKQMRSAPWSAADHPLWAQWLAANSDVLTLAHQAAGRDRYYMPAFSKDSAPHPGQTFMTLLPTLAPTRYLGRMLLSRAMMHAKEADKHAFLQDVTDLLRLGTLLRGENSYLITTLVGTALMEDTEKTIAEAITSGDLQADDARAMLAALDALPPIPALDLAGERCGLLDVWCSQAVFGLSRFSLSGTPPKASRLISMLVPVRFENQLRLINQAQDQCDAAMRIPNYQQRVQAVGATQRELYRRMDNAVLFFSGYTQVVYWVDNDKIWAPKVCGTFQTEASRRDLTRIALALAVYHAQKENYPATLSALAGPGGIFPSIPLDGFTDQPFTYRLDGRGYVLYSVGKDLHDDNADPEKDLVIRMSR